MLSNPSKRTEYDREMGLGSLGLNENHAPTGSYSSAQARSGPFGARPASGLSKRRTTFRGPPPSFYRSGGWGFHGEKRRTAQQAGSSASGTGETSGSTSPGGGFSPGQGTYDQYWGREVPHFDRQAHFERQEEIDDRLLKRQRARQRRERDDRDRVDREFPLRVILVSSLVFAGWLIQMPFWHRK